LSSLFREIIAAARLSHKNSVIELLREHDIQQHCQDTTPRDILYTLLSLLHLLC
jgi:arginine repressor